MDRLPEDFVNQMTVLLGAAEFSKFQEALETPRVTSVRCNNAKLKKSAVVKSGRAVPWCREGFYLDNRPLFTMDPLFHAGCYYVQEAASMFVGQVFSQYVDGRMDAPVVLDLCASPGGKSSHIAACLAGEGWLVSNEVMKSRVGILNENLMKWGAHNVTVSSNDPKDFGSLEGLFDVVLIDAPCSGEGMFRKDDNAVSDWSLDNVKLCRDRQRRIVSDVLPALKEDGLLIYSTCTYNEEEDEGNVRWMTEKFPLESLKINVDPNWNITETAAGYHFYPHKTEGEGFFLSLLRKTDGEGRLRTKNQKKKNELKGDQVKILKSWLKNPQSFSFGLEKDVISVYPERWAELVGVLGQSLRTLRNGLPVAVAKGKDLIPHQALAMSDLMSEDAFPSVDCSWAEAIQYLKKENFTLNGLPKGFVDFRFQGISLGFGKNIGNRCNNLYPSEWRIRMTEDESRYVPII